MKKKLLIISAVSIIVTAIASNHGYVNAAASNTVRSRGNLVLEDGKAMAIYSKDIQYLQDELDMLYGELPYYHNNENGEE